MNRKRMGALIGAGVVLMPACGSNDAATCPSKPEPVGAVVSRTVPKGASGTFMAAHNGRVVYCRGIGLADQAAKTPATCDTAYDIMSITKQFTAAAILKLEMMGRLKVTDPLAAYAGPLPADKRGITLHHLLSHTSGLTEGLGDDYDVMSRDAMLAGMLTSKLQSAPGKAFHYSNLGYSVLAAVVEKVSGLPYERFLAKYLFTPAGMRETGYVLPRWKPGQVTTEYDDKNRSQGRPVDHPWAPDGPYWNLRGNGGMISTARDVFRWHRALLGDRVLSAAAKQKLFTPHLESYAYGWEIENALGDRFAWHDGGNGWSLAVLSRSIRRDLMIFWVSNHAYQHGRWNLEDRADTLTSGMACAASTT